MKPPPRTRTKPDRNLNPEPLPTSRKVSCQWQRAEQRNLLKALKRLDRTIRGNGDIDCAFLRKHVPTRSISEINSVVEFLKNKVISLASFGLRKQTWEENKVRKPIEVWTRMASAMAGTLEEPISNAFSQMLIVSSTEPCTLKNCDPPQVYRPPKDEDGPVGRTVPLRPMPCLPVKVEHPGTNTAPPIIVLVNPAAAMSPAYRLPASSHVVTVPNRPNPPPQQQLPTTAGTLSATSPTSQSAASCCQPGAAEIHVAPSTSPQPASQTATAVTGQVTPASGSAAVVKTLIRNTQQSNTLLPSEQRPTTISTICTSKSTSPGPHTSLSSSATSQTPVPSTAASSGGPPTHPLSAPATAFHAKFGRTSKHATTDSPRMFGVKSVVDFERIYRYLSVIHQPDEKCHLTQMESAIVLDLLMSLPEELFLLDCSKLSKHLTQVYRFLSTTADSKMAGEMFKDLKDGLCAQTEAPSSRDSNRTNSPQNSDVTDGGRKKPRPDKAESQSSESADSSDQSEDMMGLCPLLNPFMVPLKLLMRK